MTLEEAHKKLDEAYKNNEYIRCGIRKGKVPDAVRVAASLISVAEVAKMESPFFILQKEREE